MWETVRLFGLAYCDLPTMLWNLDGMLRVLMLNIDPRNKKNVPFLYYVITLVSCAAYYYVYLISMLWFVFIRSRESGGDLLCAVIVLSLGISSETGCTKFIFVLFNRETVRNIVRGYLDFDAQVARESRFGYNLTKELRTVKRRAMIFWAVIMWNGIAYIAMALFTPGRHFMVDCFIFYGLEPMFESPNYEIGLTANILGALVTCYLPANITGFFIIITGYTEAQILALSEEIRLLWSDAQRNEIKVVDEDIEIDSNEMHSELTNISGDDDVKKNKRINAFIRTKLVDTVKRHTINITLFRQIEAVLRGVFAIEFMLITMGLIAELLGGLENTYIQLPYALMVVGMDCLVGQRVIDANVVFEQAVYGCHWENFDVGNKKIIGLMLQTAQKNMSMTAAGIATLNYTCFMTIIRMIYSAFTALRSVM